MYVKDALVFRMIIKTPGTAHQINPKPSPSAPTILTAARTEPPRRNNWPIVPVRGIQRHNDELFPIGAMATVATDSRETSSVTFWRETLVGLSPKSPYITM